MEENSKSASNWQTTGCAQSWSWSVIFQKIHQKPLSFLPSYEHEELTSWKWFFLVFLFYNDNNNNIFVNASYVPSSLGSTFYTLSCLILNNNQFGGCCCVQLFVIPWTVSCQSPVAMEFSRQELKWVAIPFSRGSPQSRGRTQVSCIAGDSLQSETAGKPHFWLRTIIFKNIRQLLQCITIVNSRV